MSLPTYTPQLARELRGDRSQARMCELLGLARSDTWSDYEHGRRRPGEQTWLLALIIADRHPDYGPRATVAAAQC